MQAPAREILPVSVVIPAYNCASTIAAAIESCLNQPEPLQQVIVVNDGSADATAEVLASFGDRIRVIHQANRGLAGARNTGTQAATSEFVAWMDADDIAYPGRFRAQAKVLREHPEIGLVSSDFSAFSGASRIFDFESSHIEIYYGAPSKVGGMSKIYPREVGQVWVADSQGGEHPRNVLAGRVDGLLLWGNFIHPPTVMARRSLHEAVGPFDEGLRYSSDYEVILRMARLQAFAFVDAPLLAYRLSPTQMSNASSSGKLQLETVQILEKLRSQAPELYVRNCGLVRRQMAEALYSAAASIGSADRAGAASILKRGLAARFLPWPALRAALRIVLPPPIVRTVSRLRRRLCANARLLGPN